MLDTHDRTIDAGFHRRIGDSGAVLPVNLVDGALANKADDALVSASRELMPATPTIPIRNGSLAVIFDTHGRRSSSKHRCCRWCGS